MSEKLELAVKKAGFKSLRDAWHGVRQAAMDVEDALKWSFPRPEGGGSKDPAAVFSWPRHPEDGFETLRSVALMDDQYDIREILGGHPTSRPNTIHLLPRILRNLPITIYRASDVGDIVPGSYVTESFVYANEHGEGFIRGPFEIYSMEAKPSDLFTYRDPHEFLYIPTPEEWIRVARSRVKELPEWAAKELFAMKDEPRWP